MRNLLQLLERFTKSLNRDELIKKAVIEAVRGSTGVSLKEEDILIKEGVLELSAGGAAKNEIKLKEESIKKQLKERYKLTLFRVLYR